MKSKINFKEYEPTDILDDEEKALWQSMQSDEYYSDIILQLSHIVGSENILTDDDSKNHYGKDFTQHYIPNSIAIVFPRNEQHVVDIVKLANEMHCGLVPSGGRTGYSGGAVAASHEIVVSFDKMNQIIHFDAEEKTIRCEPGVITQALQNFARQHDLFYPVDFASSGSSQIGGNVATNAGGIKVIRYGLTRNWIVGLRVITGNGDVMDLNHGLIKNACGYDLLHLFVGSEGTLGFITEVTVKLTDPPSASKVILMSVSDKKHLMNILNFFRKIKHITAFEFFSDKAAHYVMKAATLTLPFSMTAPFYVLLEYESNLANDDLAIKMAEDCINKNWVNDVAISESSDQEKNLWKWRENISMSLLKYAPYKYDIAVLPSKIAACIEEVNILFNIIFPEFEIIWFGHVGDGNLHLNILKPESIDADAFFEICKQSSHQVYALIQRYHGSVSAEHGIGLLKKEFLHYSKSTEEIQYMRAIRQIFDRNNIMNPLKLV